MSVEFNHNKFKVGDEAIAGAYEDEQIAVHHKGKLVTILEEKAVTEYGTSGQWVKTTAQPNQWVDAHWFTPIKKKSKT